MKTQKLLQELAAIHNKALADIEQALKNRVEDTITRLQISKLNKIRAKFSTITCNRLQ